jgi:hypothetical protein
MAMCVRLVDAMCERIEDVINRAAALVVPKSVGWFTCSFEPVAVSRRAQRSAEPEFGMSRCLPQPDSW